MSKFLPRSVTFTIPGKLGLGVQITVVENAGNLDFTVDVLGTLKHAADLRGLFFNLIDESDLGTLKVLGGDGFITGTQINANGVIDLGHGNNLHGAANPFDVGIAFGTAGKGKDLITGPVHFTLDAAQDLTLDDIAHVNFGARLTSVGDKLTFVAPAAPHALNDLATTHEDEAITIQVLANDTDADLGQQQQLVITSVNQTAGAHGSVTIAADHKSIIYTPDKDYAGSNFDPNSVDATFQYSISDGHGGQDSATVNVHVIPVADTPTVTYEVLSTEAGDPINMVRLKVTATQSDVDASEFIDHIDFAFIDDKGIESSTPPTGVTLTTDGLLSTTGQPGSATEYVQLLVPTGQDVNFDFKATAYTKEKGAGDPDEASGFALQHIGIDFNHNEATKNFLANDQSIWGPGSAFSVDKNSFLGPNVSLDADLGLATTEGHFKAGLTADLHLQGGAINAHVPFNITIDTTYNKTTDSLLIHTGALMASGGGFTTTGPEGNFSLGALLDFAVTIKDPILGETLYSFSTPTNVLSGSLAAFSSTSPDLPFNLPVPFGSISLDWPHLSTTSNISTSDMISSNGTSNNFIQLTADLDYMAAYFFPVFLPIEEALGPDITAEDPESTFQWLDVKASIGADLLQTFALKALGLDGTLKFEDGTTQSIVVGQDVLIQHASNLELGDLNKTIDFALSLTPNATLDNSTSIGFNANGNLYIAKNSGIFDPITLPLFSTPIASIPIDDGDAFSLAFNGQSLDFFV